MTNFQYILTERDEQVAIVTLNRPRQLNALCFQMIAELSEALEGLDRDEAVRCLVITGAGERAFAAGADIKEMADKSVMEMMNSDFASWQRIRQIRKPLIAAVQGFALGGGCELALHCDMIVASENARFGLPEVGLGVIPGLGGTQRLARALGKYRTMEMILTGAQISAQELANHGLINRLVPKGQHLSEAIKLAKTIAAQAPIAVRLAKETITAAFETSQAFGLEIERKNFFLLFSTEDMREGMHAFIEKRKPQFHGK